MPAVSQTKSNSVKRVFCNSCHRSDVHSPVELSPSLIVASILTLGLFLLFWPYRCATCGEKRPVFILSKSDS